MLQNYVGQYLIDTIFSLIGPLFRYLNNLGQLLLKGIMPEKNFDIETMKEEILKNPEIYQRSFMVQMPDLGTLETFYLPELKGFIGEDKIQTLQLMRNGGLLVTMNNVDDMNDLLATVNKIEVSFVNVHQFVTCIFIPVLPVSARVRIRISGIPLPLAAANMQEIKNIFTKTAKELKDIVLSPEMDGNTQTGNLIADALTSDLKVAHRNIKSKEGITFKNFKATLAFQSFPVKEENLGKFKPYGYMRVIPWS